MAKEAAVPADFYVRFAGTHPQTGGEYEPKLGEMVEYTIYGEVTGVGDRLRKDGEARHTVSVDVEAAWPKGAPRPDAANQSKLAVADGELIETGAQ